MTVERIKHIGYGVICQDCGDLVTGVLLKDDLGHHCLGCHPWSNQDCALCGDDLDPTEAVLNGKTLSHSDCWEQFSSEMRELVA